MAVGGGSPIDAAKGIALAAVNPQRGRDLDYRGQFASPALPIVAVPTTAGTGAETNAFGVVTDPQSRRKFYVGHASTLPAAAVLDPGLTVGLPPPATAATGMDALTHALESYLSVRANPWSDGIALQVIRMIAVHLPRAYADGQDLAARSQMLLAAHMAGIGMATTGLGLCHAIGHALGGRFDIAHGVALTMLLPQVLRFNAGVCAERLADVAVALGAGDPARSAAAECRCRHRGGGRPGRPGRDDPADGQPGDHRRRLRPDRRGRARRRGAGQRAAPADRRRHPRDPYGRGPVILPPKAPATDSTRRPAMTAEHPAGPRPVRAPRGTDLTCKGWPQEAAMRMLMNNLDPEVAEHPDELIVYGGSGRAARSWGAFDGIVASLRDLEPDETLLVQSGKPVGVFRTHEWAPRVLIANSNLVPQWATWEEFRRLEAAGLTMFGQMTAGSWIYIGTQGILQGTYETFAAVAAKRFGGSLQRDHHADRGARRDGRRAAARGHHERRRRDLHRLRRVPDQPPDRARLPGRGGRGRG